MASAKKKKKEKRYGWIVLVVLVVAAAGFVVWRQQKINSVSPYKEAMVTRGDIETFYTFQGVVESTDRTVVTTTRSMQVWDVYVQNGDRVEIDDVILESNYGEEIVAKSAGEIMGLKAQEDDILPAGYQICEVINFVDLQITIRVDEYDLKSIDVGEAVLVEIGALEKQISGTVREISKTASYASGVSYFTAIVDLEPDEALRIGMTAEAKIANNNAKGVLLLPMIALQFDTDDDDIFVMVLDADGNYVRQDVTVGVSDGVKVEIKSGLRFDQTVYYPNDELQAATGIMALMRRVR